MPKTPPVPAPTATTLTPADYLIKILTARVYDVAVESAAVRALWQHVLAER